MQGLGSASACRRPACQSDRSGRTSSVRHVGKSAGGGARTDIELGVPIPGPALAATLLISLSRPDRWRLCAHAGGLTSRRTLANVVRMSSSDVHDLRGDAFRYQM